MQNQTQVVTAAPPAPLAPLPETPQSAIDNRLEALGDCLASIHSIIDSLDKRLESILYYEPVECMPDSAEYTGCSMAQKLHEKVNSTQSAINRLQSIHKAIQL